MLRARNRPAVVLAVLAGLLALGLSGTPAPAAPDRACLVAGACFPEPPDQCPGAPIPVSGFVSQPLYNFTTGFSFCFSRLGDLKLSGGFERLAAFPPPPFETFNDGVLDFASFDQRVIDTTSVGVASVVRTLQFRVLLCDSMTASGFFICPAVEFPFVQISVVRGTQPVIRTGVSTFPGIP